MDDVQAGTLLERIECGSIFLCEAIVDGVIFVRCLEAHGESTFGQVDREWRWEKDFFLRMLVGQFKLYRKIA